MNIYGNWSQICDHWLLAANLNYEKVSNFINDEETNGNKRHMGQITTNHSATVCSVLQLLVMSELNSLIFFLTISLIPQICLSFQTEKSQVNGSIYFSKSQ